MLTYGCCAKYTSSIKLTDIPERSFLEDLSLPLLFLLLVLFPSSYISSEHPLHSISQFFWPPDCCLLILFYSGCQHCSHCSTNRDKSSALQFHGRRWHFVVAFLLTPYSCTDVSCSFCPSIDPLCCQSTWAKTVFSLPCAWNLGHRCLTLLYAAT